MIKLTVRLLIVSLLLLSMIGEASPTFYHNHVQGWYWYQNPMPLAESVNQQKTSEQKYPHQPLLNNSKQLNHSRYNPVALMNRLHHLVKQALDQAFFNPTTRNVKRYMTLQNWVTSRAMLFSQRWQQVLLADPRLNYSIKHPTSSQARELYLRLHHQKEIAAIRQFAKYHGLFFFYRGDCPYCHLFAPILKHFTTHYGIHIVPISMGDGFLPEFPHSHTNQGQAQLLHVTVYPAVYAVNPKTRKIVPVSFGFMSYQAFQQRLYTIITHFHGDLS